MSDLAAISSAPEGASYAARNSEYWKRNLWICVFGSFTTLVGLTLVLPFLPLYVEKLGAEGNAAIVEWSGIAFGATFLGTAVTAPLEFTMLAVALLWRNDQWLRSPDRLADPPGSAAGSRRAGARARRP